MNEMMSLEDKAYFEAYLTHGSQVLLPVAHSEGLSKEEIEQTITTAVIPVYGQWPKRDTSQYPNLIDLFDRRKPFVLGELHAKALVKVEERWVLDATVHYHAGDLVDTSALMMMQLMVNTVDRDPNDPTQGRKLIGISKAVVVPNPALPIGHSQERPSYQE